MSSAETWKTWPRHIQNIEEYCEIPTDLRSIYEVDTGGDYKSDIHLIHCPPEGLRYKSLTEKLLYVFDSSLIYIERKKHGLIRKQFRAENIGVIETGHVLLNAWMTIAGNNENETERITIYYNRISATYFEKMVEMLRTMALSMKHPVRYDNSVADALQEKSYKYNNFTRDIIFKDESPVRYVFQRALTGKRFRAFNIHLINDHMLMLTNYELIQITEGKRKIDRYETTKTFYILKYLNLPEYSEIGNSERMRLSLSSGVYSRSVLFEKENASAAIALLSTLNEMRVLAKAKV